MVSAGQTDDHRKYDWYSWRREERHTAETSAGGEEQTFTDHDGPRWFPSENQQFKKKTSEDNLHILKVYTDSPLIGWF